MMDRLADETRVVRILRFYVALCLVLSLAFAYLDPQSSAVFPITPSGDVQVHVAGRSITVWRQTNPVAAPTWLVTFTFPLWPLWVLMMVPALIVGRLESRAAGDDGVLDGDDQDGNSDAAALSGTENLATTESEATTVVDESTR